MNCITGAVRRPRAWTAFLAAAIAASTLIPSSVLAQYGQDPVETRATRATEPSATVVAELMETAVNQGSVRVFVELRVPTVPESTLDTERAAAQRDMIAAAQEQFLERTPGVELHRRFETIPFAVMSVDADTLAALAARSDVVSISPDGLNEPYLNRSTGVIRANRMWRAGRTGEGWAVAVLDTGILYDH